MRLKKHEFELLCSIALKTQDSMRFDDYETEFLFHLSDKVKINKKQLRNELIKKINNN